MRPASFLKGLAVGLGSVAVFTASLVLHVGTAPGRRLAASVTNEALAPVFQGRIVVDRVDHVFVPSGTIVAAARLFDPQGREIAKVDSLRARFGVWALLRSLPASGPMIIRIDEIEIASGRLALLLTPKGDLSLADTFNSKTPSTSTEPSRSVSVKLAPITVKNVRVEGDVIPELRGLARDVRATVEVGDQDVRIDVPSLDVEAALRGTETFAVKGKASGVIPIVGDAHPRVTADLRVDTRGATATIKGRFEDIIDARVIAEANPELAKALSLPVQPTKPVRLDMTLKGPLQAVAADGTINSGDGSIAVRALANLTALSITTRLDLKDVDASTFHAEVPASKISGFIEGEARVKGPYAKARVHLERGRFADQDTPILDIDAVLDGPRAKATVLANEPGSSLEAKAELDLAAADQPLHVLLTAKSDLARVRAIEPGVRGNAKVKADVTLGLASTTLRGRVDGSVNGFAWGSAASVGHAVFDADVSGTLANPRALASVRGENFAAGSIRGDRVAAGGLVRTGSVIVDAPYARIERGDTSIRVEASRVRVSPGAGVSIDDVKVTGLGGVVDGRARIAGGEIAITARGKGVRLEPLATIGALPEDIQGGGDLDVDIALGRAGVRGHAKIDFESPQNGKAPPLAAHVSIEGRGRAIDVEVHASAESIGTLDIPKGTIRIDGDPLAPATWQRAAGALDVSTDVSLAELAQRFVDPKDLRAEGRARGRIRFERGAPGGPVAIEVDFKTQGLALESPTASLNGAELTVRGRVGKTASNFDIDVYDVHGPLVSLRSAIAMGLSSKTTLASVQRSPLHATVVIPARSLDPISIAGERWGSRTRAAAVFEAAGTVADAKFSGWVRSAIDGLGSLRVDELAAEWRPAKETLPRGTASVKAHVDLAALARELGERAASLPKMTGIVELEAQAHRHDGEAMPSGKVSLRTRGLTVTDPIDLTGTDLRASAELHAQTGDVIVSATAWDELGTVAVVDAKAQLPGPLTPANIMSSVAHYAEIPMSARAAVPPRPLSSVLAMLDQAAPGSRREVARAKRMEGGIALEADVEGTLAAPQAVVRAYGLGLRQIDRNAAARNNNNKTRIKPIDAAVYATYNGKRADIGLTVIDQNRTSLQGAATVVVSTKELLETGEASILASADVRARGLRLGAIPILGEQAKGDLDADVMLRNYGEDARLEATINAKKLEVQRIQFATAEARVLAEDKKLAASVGLAQADGGWVGVMLRSDMTWGGAASPSIDPKGSIQLEYRADKFRLAGLRPVLRTVLPEVDGLIDGRGKVMSEKGAETAEGSLQLRAGTAYVATLGQQVDDVAADIRLASGSFFVENARARIDKGEVLFAASGRLAGLTPTGVNALLVIPDRRELPVYIDGVRYGNISGRVGVALKMTPKEIDVTADVPKLRFDLAALDPRQVQNLDPAEEVAIGIRDEAGALQETRLQKLERGKRGPNSDAAGAETAAAQAVTVHVKLGNDVTLSQGTMLFVPLQGNLDVFVREELRLRGKITLTNGGLVNVKGRKFRVENGTITWTENDDPGNPVVIAAASWQAPDATNVVASFTGPAQTGKLSLRSEPAHTQGEILSLLLFGTADGRTGGGGGGVAGTAASAGAPIATGGFSQALSKATDLELEATIESPDGKAQRPEVSWRISPRTTIQIGSNVIPSPTQRDKFLLTIERRLSARWSVQATGGNLGTAIFDGLWQYRY